MMNSIEMNNIGYPVLSNVVIKYRYSQKAGCVQNTTGPSDTLIAHGETYKWKNVFRGKKLFGENRVSSPKISSIAVNASMAES